MQDIRQYIHAQRQILLQHTDEIRRMLARGIGVQMAADAFNFHRDVLGAAAFRALEGHMLQHMGDTVVGDGFITRPGIDPDTNGGGLQSLAAFRDYPQAIGQGCHFHSHGSIHSFG